MVPNEELHVHILTIHLNRQREDNLFIKDKMLGPKVSFTVYGGSTVMVIYVPLFILIHPSFVMCLLMEGLCVSVCSIIVANDRTYAASSDFIILLGLCL